MRHTIRVRQMIGDESGDCHRKILAKGFRIAGDSGPHCGLQPTQNYSKEGKSEHRAAQAPEISEKHLHAAKTPGSLEMIGGVGCQTRGGPLAAEN